MVLMAALVTQLPPSPPTRPRGQRPARPGPGFPPRAPLGRGSRHDGGPDIGVRRLWAPSAHHHTFPEPLGCWGGAGRRPGLAQSAPDPQPLLGGATGLWAVGGRNRAVRDAVDAGVCVRAREVHAVVWVAHPLPLASQRGGEAPGVPQGEAQQEHRGGCHVPPAPPGLCALRLVRGGGHVQASGVPGRTSPLDKLPGAAVGRLEQRRGRAVRRHVGQVPHPRPAPHVLQPQEGRAGHEHGGGVIHLLPRHAARPTLVLLPPHLAWWPLPPDSRPGVLPHDQGLVAAAGRKPPPERPRGVLGA
mmetsp:Transcript_14849/g.34279  ORF Transcript_14849/g.34279 Transcript_14849/m.34279 type:complete len:302 (+) Transcript_14849:106-1011(+)